MNAPMIFNRRKKQLSKILSIHDSKYFGRANFFLIKLVARVDKLAMPEFDRKQ